MIRFLAAVVCLQELLWKNCGNANTTHSHVTTQLEAARIEKGLSIADVCRCTGLSYDNYIKYERCKVHPQHMDLESLRKISEVLGVELLSPYHRFKSDVSANVRAYMTSSNLSISEFARLVGVSMTTIKHWRAGKCAPSYEIWEKFFK